MAITTKQQRRLEAPQLIADDLLDYRNLATDVKDTWPNIMQQGFV